MPSSSAHMALGRTTSASSAVSERKKSLTARKSRSPSRLMTRRASGALTATLDASTSRVRTPPSVPSASSSSKARLPGHRQVVGVDAPDGGDVRAGGRVRQRAVAGQLVGLLPVLAAALPVALAGDGAPAAARPAGQPERERQVDPRLGGVGAAAVLLGAARGEDDRLLRAGEGEDGAPLVGDRHAGEPLDPVGPVGGDAGPDVVEAGGAGGDVRPRRPGPRRARCAAGRWPARGRCRAAAAGAARRCGRWPCAAGRRRRAARRARGRRRSTASPAASCRPGCCRPGRRRRPRRCRSAGTACRGRGRTRGWPRPRPRTCRSGRCSRWRWCAARPGRTCRTGRPARWSATRRRSSRRRRGRTGPGCARSRRPAGRGRRPRWPRPAGWCGRRASARTSGRSSRSGWSSSSVDDQPLEHRPPLLVGKSAGTRVAGRSPAVTFMPHCSEQYGQWVSVVRDVPSPRAADSGEAAAGMRRGSVAVVSHRLPRRQRCVPSSSPASARSAVSVPRVVEWRA